MEWIYIITKVTIQTLRDERAARVELSGLMSVLKDAGGYVI